MTYCSEERLANQIGGGGVRKVVSVLLVLLVVMVFLSGCMFLLPKDLQRAINIVKDEILHKEVPPNSDFICSWYSEILEPGTSVDLENPGDLVDQSVFAPTGVVIEDKSFLFLLDLDPGAYFAHTVKAILVAESGQYKVLEGEWLPRINGVVPEELKDPIPSRLRIVDQSIRLKLPKGIVSEPELAPITPIWQWGEAFIVVQGLMPNEDLFQDAQNTYMQFLNFAFAYQAAMPEGRVDVQGLVQSNASNVLSSINSYASKRKVVTVFIIAHGNVDRVKLGGIRHYAWQFATVMSDNPSTCFNFLLGSCKGGSFINDLNTLGNVRTVLTACKSTESAYPDWDVYGSTNDHNPEDAGSEWTSSIVARAISIVNNAAQFSLVKSEAYNFEVPTIRVLFQKAHLAALGTWGGYTQNLDLTNPSEQGNASEVLLLGMTSKFHMKEVRLERTSLFINGFSVMCSAFLDNLLCPVPYDVNDQVNDYHNCDNAEKGTESYRYCCV